VDIIHHHGANLPSSQGFMAIHFACIGGQLSTLRLLLDESPLNSLDSPHGITPLHLCIFFSDEEVRRVASLLLDRGCNLHMEQSGHIDWEYHDIRLEGCPLD
jgi:ankyrin repeat protein